MATRPATTVGVKLDDPTRERLRRAAQSIDRTPHWFIKQAIFSLLEQVERGVLPVALALENGTDAVVDAVDLDAPPPDSSGDTPVQPFLEFALSIQPQSVLRAAITAASRRPERECVPMLLEQARLAPQLARATGVLARDLAGKLRAAQRSGGAGRDGLVQRLVQEFSLSSQEGVALMCLAEALLRIPDKATRDALIRDKISSGNWQAHLGHSPSLFVNAATWGLLLTGKLVATHNESGLSTALARLIGRGGEPLIRKGVDIAMRMMGEQFVTGETISGALANARRFEASGFRYSYDMLGEAAMTDADACRYLASYEQAIDAIGQAAQGRGIYEGPGISVKLSALHPRYSRARHERVMAELYPRLLALVLLARRHDIGINIDAEEADRLEISLDLLERLCFAPELAGWNGIGFVIQAYQKRCPYVIDQVIDLARRSGHRIMVRLVKGAYWDSEIKRAQVDGLEGYQVFTRKTYTDISYIAAARKLLAVPDAVYPQFATHNAHTLAAVYHLAGQNWYPGQYEFQCLHGMGEALYEHVVGPIAAGKLNRPCRIYAPVGTHETLLAYLVRRLLENGANTSFVNRIADDSIALDELIADPVVQVEALLAAEGVLGAPHPRIPLPRDLYGAVRANAAGIDLSNEQRLASLSAALLGSVEHDWRAVPMLGDGERNDGATAPVLNPADRRDRVGTVIEASPADVADALQLAVRAAPIWQATPAASRAATLERAADLMEARMQSLMGLIVREAGKTLANAVAEVREAVDFLRYDAAHARLDLSNDTHRPLGPVVCISPWNFPLAIFTGQVAAALAAGNVVLAKPAEQTPLVAAEAVRILRLAGVPAGAVQLLPGRGESVGARLVDDARIRGVLFTGSTGVARLLQRSLAGRLDAQGQPLPLIAETGGQNAMIVDSSALAEQVVADVLNSAFDSAGQRCSALRLLCLQDEVAAPILTMLKGGMAELALGNPDRLAVDVGPVIDAAARDALLSHIETLRQRGCAVHQSVAVEAVPACRNGSFVAPTLIEIDSIDDLEREVFGPVLHVLRYRRDDLDALVTRINATGYGLTLGLHTRIDETVARVVARARVGNLYVNRNIVGAVVGVQPFGGEGLSGTGPKAGGPLYLLRLLAQRPHDALQAALASPANGAQPVASSGPGAGHAMCAAAELALNAWLGWNGQEQGATSPVGTALLLPGPTGERNTYALLARDVILGLADNEADLLAQLGVILSVGASVLWPEDMLCKGVLARLPVAVQARIRLTPDWSADAFDAVVFHGDSDQLAAVCRRVAERDGAIVGVQGLARGARDILPERLMLERSLSINTAAAGGNASLMTIG